MSVKDDLFAIAEPVVQALGYQLVEVEYVKEGPRWMVRVYLYHPDGVALEDCQKASSALDDAFEAKDPVKNPYFLEVSSPGAERVLKTEREYKLFQGRLVKATLKEPIDKEQVLYGKLGPATAEIIHIEDVRGGDHALARDNVKQIRLALQSSVPAGK